MNTGNYIFDYIYELTEDKYITKEEAMRRLDALGLIQADKRYWFPLFSNAKNPY